MLRRERLDRAVTAVRGVRAELKQLGHVEGREPWELLKAVDATWKISSAPSVIQRLLQDCAKAIAETMALRPVAAAAAATDGEEPDADEVAINAALPGLRADALTSLRLLYYLDHCVRVSAVASRLVMMDADLGAAAGGELEDVRDEELAAGLARFSPLEQDDGLTKFQSLLLYLLNQAFIRGYRRYGSDMFQRRVIDGKDTCAWTRVSSIKDFIFDVTRKEVNFAQWCNLTSNVNNANGVVEYLTACRDLQLQDLVKNRHIFAFRNGVYVSSEDKFYLHADVPSRLVADEVACRYFDLDFDDKTIDDHDDWFGIDTPHLQGILDHQKFGPDISRWLYVFIGRLLYEVDELDAWQVIPFFKGQAGTGKSTLLLKVCAQFFDADDVGILSNNIERKFGLYAIADKLIFVAPEIKGDLQMEQAEFQSVVSGEAVQLNIKYKKAQTVARWRVPGVLAGNEAPNWVDNAGSISRRLVIFDFTQRVDNADMDLGKKLALEMPAILRKCNRAYRDAARKCASRSIWKFLPPYFQQTKQDLVESVNSLESFLASGAIAFDENAYMPFDDFVGMYHLFCDARGLRRMKVDKDFKTRLTMHNLPIDRKARLVYPRTAGDAGAGCVMGGVDWLLGVDVRAAVNDDTNDDNNDRTSRTKVHSVKSTAKNARIGDPDCGGDF